METNCVLCEIGTKFLAYMPQNFPTGITRNLFAQFDKRVWDPPIWSGVIKDKNVVLVYDDMSKST